MSSSWFVVFVYIVSIELLITLACVHPLLTLQKIGLGGGGGPFTQGKINKKKKKKKKKKI